jgi:hypothetical protein
MEPRFWIGVRNAIPITLTLWALIIWGIVSLFSSGCAHHEAWSPTDKAFFAGVVASQGLDYAVTEEHLDRGGHINNAWNWKYGTDRPSDGQVALVKAAELGLCLIVADALPSTERKAFLSPVSAVLLYCSFSW